MTRLFALCALLALLLPAAALADQPNTYNDPAMSYTAPADFTRVPVPAPSSFQDFDHPTIVAAYGKNIGSQKAVTLTVQLDSYDGSLDGYVMQSENDLRNQGDGVFINKKSTTLSNGMPAYLLTIRAGSGFNQIKRFELIWVDGVRGVTIAMTARLGTLTDKDVQAAFANASAVRYPLNRDY